MKKPKHDDERSLFEIYDDPIRQVRGAGATYGEYSLNFRPVPYKAAADYAERAIYGTFFDLLRDRPETHEELSAIARRCTRNDPSGERTKEVYDYVIDVLTDKWSTIESSWRAYARTIARRHSHKLAKKAARLRIAQVEPEYLESVSKGGEASNPLHDAIHQEELSSLERAVAALSPAEQLLVEAFKKAESVREAARIAHIPEATFRLRFQKILTKIQFAA